MPWKGDKKKKYRIAGVVAIVFVVAGGIYLSRDFVAAKTRGFRAVHNLEKAEAYLKEQEFEDSYKHALMARQLNPQSVEPLRVLVRAALQSGHVRSLDYCNALFLSPAATEEDKLLVLDVFRRLRDSVGFVRFYNLLPAETRQNKEFIALRVEFLIDRNAFDSARRILEAEIEKDRDRQFLLLLASLLVQDFASPEDMERGQRIIAELASVEEPDDTARTAFEMLGFIDPSRIRPELLGDLGNLVQDGNPRNSQEYIAAASLAIAAARSPEERSRIVAQAIEDQGEIAPSQLAAWLQRINDTENAIAFLTEERSASRPDLYQQRFVALLDAEKFDEAGEWLKNPPPGIESISLWLARARLARREKERADENDENNAWEQAFQVAQNTASRNEYLRIYEVARSEERIDLATRAILQAPKHGIGIMPPAADVVAPMIYLTQEDRLDDLLYLTEALRAREPNNLIVLNNLLYLYLLREERIAESTEIAGDLIANRGSELAPRDLLSLYTTRAMGLLLQGKDEEALKSLPDDSRVWNQATDADRAIRALALERNDKDELAAGAWDRVDLNQLTTAEKRLFFPTSPEEERKSNPRLLPRPDPTPAETSEEDTESSSPQTARIPARQSL